MLQQAKDFSQNIFHVFLLQNEIVLLSEVGNVTVNRGTCSNSRI